MRSMKQLISFRVVALLAVLWLMGLAGGVGGTEAPKKIAAPPSRIVVGGTGSALGVVSLLAQAFMEENPGISIRVLPSLGSGGGIKALQKKRIDLGLSVRPLKEKEKVQGLTERVYATTPFVFATTATSSNADVSYGQLEGIYSGTVLSWPDGSPIRLIVRPPKESDTLLIKSMSPGLDKAVDKALARYGMIFAVTDQDTANILESTKGALASLSLGQIMSENREVKILSLEGVPPLISGKVNLAYPYFKTYYMILRPDISEETQKFADFIMSDKGMEILESTGHSRQ